MKYQKLIYFVISIMIALSACSKKIIQQSEKHLPNVKTSTHNSFDCQLTAYNLSEDASPFSTKNDELILLVYSDTLDKRSPNLIFQDYFIFNGKLESKEFTLNDSLMINSTLTFVLIEMDTKKNLLQIEPVVKVNLDKIFTAKQNGDLKTILDLFGDDDLLGIQEVSSDALNQKDFHIDFKGIHLFDAYNFRIEIKNAN